jgi:uncharacterized protein YqhQ
VTLRASRLIAAAFLTAPLSDDKKDTVGGQAIIEGVMMRGKEKVAWAVRRPDGGITVESYPFVSVTKRVAVLGIPVIRGVINLFESLKWGFAALERSADIAVAEDADGGAPAGGKADGAEKKKTSAADKIFFALSMAAALALSLGLFMYAPMWTVSRVPFINDSPMLFNLSAGIIRIALFLTYISLISLWGEIRRVFEYHGAEHKTIFAYEDGKPLTVGNIDPYATVHPRCGTSFLILVAICSIFLFSIIDTLYIEYFGAFVNIFHRFVVHLVLIPLVAGMSYEFLKLSAKYQNVPLVGILIKPGLWLQKITTRKPAPSQIEVAAKALEAAL